MKNPAKEPAAPITLAYSYIRFSHPSQIEGDSLRRQTTATEEWCRRNDITLDTSLSLRDLGTSAFRGKHRGDKAALGGFLKLVERGKVPRGSYLVIENLDRLSREEERPALRLWMDILDAGINIVQLSPETVFRHERSDMLDIMRAIMELARGHGESAIKSERIGQAWANKRALLRKNGTLLTHRLPAWVEERDGKLSLIPQRAAAVKRIYALAVAGYGLVPIVKKLTEEGVPAFGERVIRPGRKRSASSGQWLRSYVGKILKDRRAVGEMQPCGPNRKPEGRPLLNYYPPVITEDEWIAARAGVTQRKRKPGRIGSHVNIFGGMLYNARDGKTYYAALRPDGRRLLVNTSVEGGARSYAFSFETFERAILSLLAEIDPADILGQTDGPDEVQTLAADLARVEVKITELENELAQGDVAALGRELRRQEAQHRELTEKLALAKQKAACPLSEAWGEAQTLLGVIDGAADPQDARLRLRAALRQIVSEVWLLVVPLGGARRRDRLAAVQIYFSDGKGTREYVILHQAPRANRTVRHDGRWWARSLAEVAEPGALDLRKPEHARKLESTLAALDLAALAPDGAEARRRKNQ
jgi:DNA invertase Pin-like site-specific DNA recombinase